jgi:hypothetical protein
MTKLTKNEKITLRISIAALSISLLQFIFSIPLISEYFYSPDIIGLPSKNEILNDKSITVFYIKNEGNRAAENLLISFKCGKNDSIIPLPKLDLEFRTEKNGEPLKDVYITLKSSCRMSRLHF